MANLFNRSSWSKQSIYMLCFGMIVFFFSFSDAIMSYFSPVEMENHFQDAFLMGLVLSSSSAVGLVADLLISKFFPHYDYRFFVKWLIILATLFPLTFLMLPAMTLTYFAAMAIWGVYYEFSAFSQFNFIHQTVDTHQHARAWSVVSAVHAFAFMVGPVAAGIFLSHSRGLMLGAVIASLMVAGVFFLILQFISKKHERPTEILAGRTFKVELRLWKLLLKKIWPVYIFFLALVILDTSFWTVGPLISEEIVEHSWLGALLLPAYTLPSLLTPFIIQKISPKVSKKRIAFVSAIIGSAIMGGGAFILGEGNPLLTIVVLVGALFISIDYPEIEAVFEDYISRIDGYENDLVGLRSSASSIAYIIGPILAGFTADILGYGRTMGLFAIILMVVSVIVLIVTPRKIRMDLKGMEEIAESQAT